MTVIVIGTSTYAHKLLMGLHELNNKNYDYKLIKKGTRYYIEVYDPVFEERIEKFLGERDLD